MISFKMFTERFFITEAIPLKYAKKHKMSRKYSGAYTDKLDQIFGDKDRLIYPLDINYNESSNHRLLNDIDNLLFKNGYSVSSMADYIKGVAYKTTPNGADYKNPVRIGKLLEKFEPMGEIEVTTRENGRRQRKKIPGKPLLHAFKNDPVRGSGQYYTVISRHPYDVSGSSTDRNWTSCMDLGTPRVEYPNKDANTGANRKFVARDVSEGSLIAYVVTKDELLPNGKVSLRRPLSRILIKPHKSPNGLAYTVGGMYGNKYDDFSNFMMEWTMEKLNNKVQPTDRVYRSRKLYKDANSDVPAGFDFHSGSKAADQAMENILSIRNEKYIGNDIEFTSTDNGQGILYDMTFTYEYTPGFVSEFEDLDDINGLWDIGKIPTKYDKEIAEVIAKSFGSTSVNWRFNVVSTDDKKKLVVEYFLNFLYSDGDDKHHIDDDDLIELIEERLHGLESYDYELTKRKLAQTILRYDPVEMEKEKRQYLQNGVDEFMQVFHNHTAFKNNPKYINSPLHNLTPITIPEFMAMELPQQKEYAQFLLDCRTDIFYLLSMKEEQMRRTDRHLRDKQVFRDRVNDAIDEWMKSSYGLDLVEFNDRKDKDWSIFKQRPYFDDSDAYNKIADISDDLNTLSRHAKNLIGHKTHRTDQI